MFPRFLLDHGRDLYQATMSSDNGNLDTGPLIVVTNATYEVNHNRLIIHGARADYSNEVITRIAHSFFKIRMFGNTYTVHVINLNETGHPEWVHN